MTTFADIDFARIAPRCGSQERAFEELCCQLALSDVPEPRGFRRIRGAGGDGGVECVWTASGGDVHGWQVKYIFDFARALKKTAASLATARKNHPTLKRYVICLPFELSGSKGRNGRSQLEKFEAFKEKEETDARIAGQSLEIELWSAFRLRDRLLGIDASGGRRRFWFESELLDGDWFTAHLDTAIRRAGPRYNPELHHGHVLDETLEALGSTNAWRARQEEWQRRLSKLVAGWERALAAKGSANSMDDPFPACASTAGAELLTDLKALTDLLDLHGDPAGALSTSKAAQEQADRTERELADDIDTRFGEGRSDSVPFRQFQAEYQCCFPARHLDECRKIRNVLAGLTDWMESPAQRASEERVLLVSGPAGIGKTHGLCDVAMRRRGRGLPTVLVSGGQFSSERSMWECLSSALGLDGSWSRDILLDALDTAGAAAGRLLMCVDALDERARRSRWLDDLPELIEAVTRRPNLGLCVAVRDGYESQVIRDDLDVPVFLHPGFGDAVFDACASFFAHFDLEPPIGPLLEPEFANPLFLLVLCRTMRDRRLTTVPPGWRGTKGVLDSLLAARDDELRRPHPGVGNRGVSAAMHALAGALPEGGVLSWSAADTVVDESLPRSQQGRVELLDHLVGLGLLRVVPGEGSGSGHEEDHVDIAFGRLRHHLLADRLTAKRSTVSPEGLRRAALDDPGLAESLALVLPERGYGELVDLASDPHERRALMDAWLASLPWRDGDSLGVRVEQIVVEALRERELVQVTVDALVTLALRPGHPYDHRFFHEFLTRLPMPQRDGGLCAYLHQAFERTSPPSPVVRALRSPWEFDPKRVDQTLREAWCIVLGWCGAAADRRVRDHATKAAVRITEVEPGVWPSVVELFAEVDDDSVLERILCAAYGATLRNPDATALSALAVVVRDHVLRRGSGTTQHALVRGHAQMIGEWAAYRGVLPSGVAEEDFRPPHDDATEVRVPTEDELKQYDDPKNFPQIYASVMSEWTGDFAKYTMPRALGEYEALIGREATRRWVLGTIMELGYRPRLHASYDKHMIARYGHGRGRPRWAERIGKKYQRIALGRLVGVLGDVAHQQHKPSPTLASLRMRDLDPTLLQKEALSETEAAAEQRWWEPVAMDFAATAATPDEAWLGADDFPDPTALVAPLTDPKMPNQRWRLLDGYFSWDDTGLDSDRERERDVWMMIKGYLVPTRHLAACWRALGASDFMGRWMVEGFEKEGGMYVGEYPWAPPFPEVREPAEAWQAEARGFDAYELRPTANQLICTGDSWQEGPMGITVPSAELVLATKTRWDGTSGFQKEDGSLVFQDPSVAGGVPSGLGNNGLWIDDTVLSQLQSDLDVGVVWTVLAERRILRDHGDDNPCGPKHISMSMYLHGQDFRSQ